MKKGTQYIYFTHNIPWEEQEAIGYEYNYSVYRINKLTDEYEWVSNGFNS